MLTAYIEEAMKRARYKILEVIEDWLLLGLKLGHEIPILGDIDLNQTGEHVEVS